MAGKRVELNQDTPEFELEDLHGKSFRLSELRGKHVFLVFNRGFS